MFVHIIYLGADDGDRTVALPDGIQKWNMCEWIYRITFDKRTVISS